MKKIILSSDCNGLFQQLFEKVTQLHQKNKFDFMFMTGNVCCIEGISQYQKIVNGSLKVPLPTYFIDSSEMSKILHTAHPTGKKIADNFYFLGQSGIVNLDGLSIAFMSGKSSQFSGLNLQGKQYTGQYYQQSDILNLLQKCKSQKVDILLTNEWPKQINFCDLDKDSIKTKLISLLSHNISPKYHLSASGKTFFRMEPYLNNSKLYTHFINVAEMKKQTKDKYLLAIQTVPFSKNPPEEKVSNYLPCPFDSQIYAIKKSQQKPKMQGWDNTFNFVEEQAQVGFKDSLRMKQKGKGRQKQQSAVLVNENTYVYFDGVPFQARNSDVQDFLERWGQIIKIQVFKEYKGKHKSGIAKFSTLQSTRNCLQDSGKYSLYQNRIKFKPKSIEQKYSNADCWFCYKNQKFDKSLLIFKGKYIMVCLDKGPVTEYHLQIVPINHVDNTGKLQSLQLEEFQIIKNQLSKYFSSNGYEVLIYQRHMRLSEQISHCLVQFIALKQPKGLIHRFHQLNTQQNLKFHKISQETRKSQYFILLEINGNQLIREIYPKEKLQFDFMRKVVCQLMNKPQRINWRSCQRKNQNEINLAKKNMEQILKKSQIMLQ